MQKELEFTDTSSMWPVLRSSKFFPQQSHCDNLPLVTTCPGLPYIFKNFTWINLEGASGIWGVLAIGFFADNPYPLDTTSGRSGLFKGKVPKQFVLRLIFLLGSSKRRRMAFAGYSGTHGCLSCFLELLLVDIITVGEKQNEK